MVVVVDDEDEDEDYDKDDDDTRVVKCAHYIHYSLRPLPSLSSGTHGYMAPEVLAKGTAYDSSADWFSLGCMLYKLLKG